LLRDVQKLGVDFLCCDKPEDVVSNSDIVITATSPSEPVFKGEWLELGTHVNGVSSHTPTTRELDEVAIKRSKVVVDLREAALKEAGDLIIPISKGVLVEDHIYTNLGEIVLGQKLGRVNDNEITLFK
jgi:ornithine cyclodeaminase/alanine dehydrogenase